MKKVRQTKRSRLAEKADVNPARQARINAKVTRVQVVLGYVIVAVSVVAGFVLSFWPAAFGLQGSNPAIGFALAALALFRLWALRRELKRQGDEVGTTGKCSVAAAR